MDQTQELDPNLELATTLAWAATNNVSFFVANTDDLLTIQARCNNLAAEYPINEPHSGPQLGDAAWASLLAVKHGAEHHKRFGVFPPRRTPPTQSGKSPSGIGGGERQSAGSEGELTGSETRQARIPDDEPATSGTAHKDLQ